MNFRPLVSVSIAAVLFGFAIFLAVEAEKAILRSIKPVGGAKT